MIQNLADFFLARKSPTQDCHLLNPNELTTFSPLSALRARVTCVVRIIMEHFHLCISPWSLFHACQFILLTTLSCPMQFHPPPSIELRHQIDAIHKQNNKITMEHSELSLQRQLLHPIYCLTFSRLRIPIKLLRNISFSICSNRPPSPPSDTLMPPATNHHKNHSPYIL